MTYWCIFLYICWSSWIFEYFAFECLSVFKYFFPSLYFQFEFDFPNMVHYLLLPRITFFTRRALMSPSMIKVLVFIVFNISFHLFLLIIFLKLYSFSLLLLDLYLLSLQHPLAHLLCPILKTILMDGKIGEKFLIQFYQSQIQRIIFIEHELIRITRKNAFGIRYSILFSIISLLVIIINFLDWWWNPNLF